MIATIVLNGFRANLGDKFIAVCFSCFVIFFFR